MDKHCWFRVASAIRMRFGFGLVCLLAGATSVQAQQPGWSATGSLVTMRTQHRIALLANGKVLAVGGTIFTGATASAELYDPATGQWSVTGSMSKPRARPVVVRLLNGKVLAAGGANDNSAEIYDPETGAWRATGNLSVARLTSAGVLLADGKVLITGGSASRSAELYDPASGLWSPAGTMVAVRSGGTVRPDAKHHTSTLLPDGRVLVVGGDNNGALRSAELYDPATGSWTATTDLATPRFNHTATLLPSGKVLVVGGAHDFSACPGLADAERAELYDPATGQWSAASDLTTRRAGHTATLLPNGKVLVVGGNVTLSCVDLSSSELYDPDTGSWSAIGALKTAYIPSQEALLTNGKILAVGGSSGADLFDSGTDTVASVSAASFAVGGPLAPESIAAAFGKNLTTDTQRALTLPLPTQMAGVSVKVRDRFGAERLAPLFFVSPGQINYQVPAGTAIGVATMTVTSAAGIVAAGLVEITEVAPGLFSSNSNGQGVAAALASRLKADGTLQFDSVARFDSALNAYVAQTIDLGPETDQVFLILYGTGIRRRSALSAAILTIGGVGVEVSFAGAAPGFIGLDQVNVRLPRSLVGRGDVEVTLSVDGKAANPVRVSIR